MTDPREVYGRIVRETWVAWAREQYRPKPSWLLPWEEIDRGRREADMRIGEAVANHALTENAATWGISCTSCAAYLDRASAERERAERAEAMLAGARSSTGSDLGRAAYDAESAWLDQFAPGGHSVPWDSLDPEHRGVYQRIGEAVAAAERERVAGLVQARADELAREANALSNAGHADGPRKEALALGWAQAAALIREAGR